MAGNTFTGMFTRLTFRKPFQVGRGGIQELSGSLVPECIGLGARLSPGQVSDGVRLAPAPQIETRPSDVDVVRLDLVPQQAAGLAVQVAGHGQPLRDAAEFA